jgi:hypothetical protein
MFLLKIGSLELNTLIPAFLPLIKDMAEAIFGHLYNPLHSSDCSICGLGSTVLGTKSALYAGCRIE